MVYKESKMWSKITILLVIISFTHAHKEHINRIVGGEPADIKEFPHQLQLQRDDYFRCGASVISPNWVLSAAHCINDKPNATYDIRAGSSVREIGGDVHEIEKIILHPKYDPITDDYDYALIKVKKPFDLHSGKPIKIIKIAESGNDPIKGSKVTVSGWGADDPEIGVPTRNLKKVTIPVVEWKTCKTAYGNANMLITERMMCAGITNNDSCQGDSGGPLIQGGVQVGVVSWGYGCGAAGFPGIYARIGYPEIRKWITDVTGV